MANKLPKDSADQREKYLRRWEKIVERMKWLVDHDIPQTIIKIIIWIWKNWFFK